MSQITVESSAVHNYLSHLQGAINRMAANSASSKTWCITLISAVVVFASDKEKPDAVWMATIPLLLFFILDSYYLGLERKFRTLYNNFVKKLYANNAVDADLFMMTPPSQPSTLMATLQAMTSISVWAFYVLTLLLMVILRSWLF